jgi:aspartokinase
MSINKLAIRYIEEHPSIKDCVLKDLINYSALAREICDFHKIDKFDAVLIACRRYFWNKKQQESHENKIRALLKDAKMHIKNKIIVAILEKPRDMETIYLLQKKARKEKNNFNLIEGEDVVTVITSIRYKEIIEKTFKNLLRKLNGSLIQITLIFDEKIEVTSGVVTYIYGLLSDSGINIREEMSCWTDLMIILDEKDMAKAMEVLNF